MNNEERNYHLGIAEQIEARANAIIEQVRRGEKNRSLLKIAKKHLADAARVHTGSRKALAEKLGVSERTLYRRLRDRD